MTVERPRRAASERRGRYLVRKPTVAAGMYVVDALARLIAATRMARAPINPPRRLLVAVGGQLGDAVIATGVLPVLRYVLPETEIGLLVSSWNRVVFEGHPAVARLHSIDHWKLDRAAGSRIAAWRWYRRALPALATEVRAVGYDAAVDLYAYFPNMAELLWRARIPTRIGWETGGFGPLYTTAESWPEHTEHMLDMHIRLLRHLAPAADWDAAVPRRYDLAPAPAAAVANVRALLDAERVADQSFLIVHMGAGAPVKEWPEPRWRALVQRLAARGSRIFLTGRGPAQADAAARTAAGLPGVLNVVDRLGWHELVELARRASAMLTVDTVAGHIAAAVGTPCIALWTGINDPARWRPLGDQVELLTHDVPCAPCYRGNGCAGMDCLRGLGVDDVLPMVATLQRVRGVS